MIKKGLLQETRMVNTKKPICIIFYVKKIKNKTFANKSMLK